MLHIESVRVTVRCIDKRSQWDRCKDNECPDCAGRGRYVLVLDWDAFVDAIKDAIKPEPYSG